MVNDIYDLYREDMEFANSLDLYGEALNKSPYQAIEKLVNEMVRHDWEAMYMDAKICAKNYLH